MLFRDSDGKYFAGALYVDCDWRFGRTGDGLDLGLEFVVLADPDNLTIIFYPDQDDATCCIGKGAYLATEVGSDCTFEPMASEWGWIFRSIIYYNHVSFYVYVY